MYLLLFLNIGPILPKQLSVRALHTKQPTKAHVSQHVRAHVSLIVCSLVSSFVRAGDDSSSLFDSIPSSTQSEGDS